MSSSAASTTHPRDIHDRMARNYFGVPQNMANLLEQTLPAKVCKRLDLSSLEPTGETFITGEYEKYIADLVFTCRTNRDLCMFFLSISRSLSLQFQSSC